MPNDAAGHPRCTTEILLSGYFHGIVWRAPTSRPSRAMLPFRRQFLAIATKRWARQGRHILQNTCKMHANFLLYHSWSSAHHNIYYYYCSAIFVNQPKRRFVTPMSLSCVKHPPHASSRLSSPFCLGGHPPAAQKLKKTFNSFLSTLIADAQIRSGPHFPACAILTQPHTCIPLYGGIFSDGSFPEMTSATSCTGTSTLYQPSPHLFFFLNPCGL